MLPIEVYSRTLPTTTRERILPPVTLDLLNEKITVAELIQRTVEEQVRELLVKQALNAEEAFQALERQYMTVEEGQSQVRVGAVRFPSKKPEYASQISVESATTVKNALRAFEQHVYLILVDGQIAQSLEEELTFGPGRKVTFLRLVPLVGG